MIVRNTAQFMRQLETADKARKAAARLAVRVEVNRLRLKMKEEIKAGAPGGQKFAPLSDVAKLYRGKRSPLARLAIPVRYWERQTANGEIYSVGFQGGAVTGLNGSVLKSNQLSRSWVRLAILHQQGGRLPLGEFNRNRTFDGMSLRTKYQLILGGQRKSLKKGRYRLALRKSTTSINIPARPIIEPFWTAHRAVASRNITNNFKLKMQGARI